MKGTCSAPGCRAIIKAATLCNKHYQRIYNHGSFEPKMVQVRNRLVDNDSIKVRLFSKRSFNERGCWEWTGARSKQGYGNMGLKGKHYLPHRVSAKVFLGFDLSSPKMVLHRCDNPPCFNPDHLYIGTRKNNMRDVVERGTHRGSRASRAKLNEEKVIAILHAMGRGQSMASLGREYEVNPNTIAAIKYGRSWTHIKRPKKDANQMGGVGEM